MSLRVTACARCGGYIIFGETREGVAVCVDAAPSAQGDVELLPGDYPGGAPLLAIVHKGKKPSSAEVLLHTSHFLTCSPAKEWTPGL